MNAVTTEGTRSGSGSRINGRVSKSVVADRLLRAWHNLLETYPAFNSLAVALAVTGKMGGIAATGAVIWMLGRISYAVGVPVLRTIIWLPRSSGSS